MPVLDTDTTPSTEAEVTETTLQLSVVIPTYNRRESLLRALNALARQIRRQGFTATLPGLWHLACRQPRVRHNPWLDIIILRTFFRGRLLGFVEDAVPDLLAARGVTMRPLQAQFLLERDNPLRELVILGLQRRDLGRVGQDQRFQILR